MKRRLGAILGGVLLSVVVVAGPALAFDCYVENKPEGAGAVTEADFKIAGNTGKVVAPGAFIGTETTGAPVDIFMKGQPAEAPVPVEFVAIGTLPEQPHCNGGASGVQTLESDKCD